MTEDDLGERRYREAQLTTARDMWAYFERLAREKDAHREAEQKRAARVREKYRAIKVELNQLRKQYAGLAVQCKELDLRLRQVLSSRTWRVMEPVRVVGRAMRKIRGWSR